jgi:MFS transporter, FSR family, fosmidomycin resistance protein
MPGMFHRRSIVLLAAGHATIDLCQGVVPALVPFLVYRGDYSYEDASKLVFALSVTSSVIQPFFGQLADKLALRWLLPFSIALTGLSLSLGSQASNYSLIFSAFLLCGIGVAAFHPEAARQANYLSGPSKGVGMGIFTLGGAIGFALAPGTTTVIENYLGREGLLLLIFLTLPMALAVLSLVKPISLTEVADRKQLANRVDDWWGFGILTGATISRSIVFFGMNTFLASYFIKRFELEPSQGMQAITVLLLTSIPATLIGGWLADRYGRRLIARVGFTSGFAMILLFPMIDERWVAMAALVPFGLLFFMPSGVLVVLGQEYLPNRVGMASGVTLGLAVSVGGMVAPFLGRLADRHGVESVLVVVQCVVGLAMVSVWFLPKSK